MCPADGGGGQAAVSFSITSEPFVIGTGVEGTVSASGCPGATFELWEGPPPGKRLLELSVAATGGAFAAPTAAFEGALARQIPARLELFAVARCTNGKSGTSTVHSASFFPVAEVPPASDVLLERFELEGSGPSATLVGCADLAGTPSLVRLAVSGAKVASTPSPFPCAGADELTPLSSTGPRPVRWLVHRADVNGGAVAFVSRASAADDLTPVVVVRDAVTGLGAAADGQAIVVHGTNPSVVLARLDPARTNPVVWSVPAPPGRPNADPLISGTDVYVSVWDELIGATSADVVVYRYAFADGAQLSRVVVATYTYPSGLDLKLPATGAFSASGEQLYVPRWFNVGGAVESAVSACSTRVSGCPSPALETGRLAGAFLHAVPLPSSLLVVGPSALTVANLPSGTWLLPTPLTVSGGLEFTAIVPGPSGSAYALAQGPSSASADQQSQELLALLSRGAPPAWRLPSPAAGSAGSLWIAPDGARGAILRVGTTYVRTLTPGQYCTLAAGVPCF